jgi:hypothetical protein
MFVFDVRSSRKLVSCLLAAVAVLSMGGATAAEDGAPTAESNAEASLVILPRAIRLTGTKARQPVLIERVVNEQYVGQVVTTPVEQPASVALATSDQASPDTAGAAGVEEASPGEAPPGDTSERDTASVKTAAVDTVYSGNWSIVSDNPEVAVVENGVVLPRGNGQATLHIKKLGIQDDQNSADVQSAVTEVTVEGMDAPFIWSHRNHVQSILTKAGCNSGACHGAAAGKNGFRLSLRGYDAMGDYLALTRDARGRRVLPEDPARSLILTKPTGTIPHGGGMRFQVDSYDYNVLLDWIADGTLPPDEADPRIERIEMLPASVVLDPTGQQRLLVQAYFSDGRIEDVTHWTKFTATNGAVADVDPAGRLRLMGHGEGGVTAWYQSKVAAASVTVPYENEMDDASFADFPRNNLIDEYVVAKLKALSLPPSGLAKDAQFLRRAYLDTIGTLPTADEARAFISDEDPEKRHKLIDHLLARPEFVDYWTYKWSDLLLVNSEKLQPSAMWSYYSWIRNHVAANTPWDKIAREMITATGSTLENGATNFYVLHQDPLDLAETTSVAMLGMSINCARCHNHPLEKWTNDQYYAMVNLFARVRTKSGSSAAHMLIFDADSGDVIQPLRGRPQRPQPLDGEALELQSDKDRRAHLADWLTSPENPYFTRAIVNRVWANYFGVGLVEKVDDMRATNPASNESLLSAMAEYTVEQGYDLKALMRLILQSSTYQRSSTPTEANTADKRFYSRYYPRRLMAEVMLDGFSQVTGANTKFEGYPATWRALQLPDSNVSSYFLKTFGRPERLITCDCERTAQPSMVQALHLSNGDSINQKLREPDNRIGQMLKANAPDAQIIEEAYLSALARYPSEAEKTQLAEILAQAGDDKRAVVEDLYWSILTSKEFLFTH